MGSGVLCVTIGLMLMMLVLLVVNWDTPHTYVMVLCLHWGEDIYLYYRFLL